MMEQLFGQRVPGFRERNEAVAYYKARSGRAVVDLDFYEVFAWFRALAINDRHQRITVAGLPPKKWSGAEARRRGNPMIEVLSQRMGAWSLSRWGVASA